MGGPQGQEPYASLAMYPFEALRPSWERLWEAVHGLASWTPPALRWSGPVHEHWRDPACVVAHACGWPVVTSLRGSVTVAGAFRLAIDDADGHRYRSVLVSNTAEPAAERDPATLTAAANADDSLSGWISLVSALGATQAMPPLTVHWTGSHLASIAAVGEGLADVASVDAVTWQHARRLFPDMVRRLHDVGRGPLVPSLPVVVNAGTQPELVDELRHALAAAIADPCLEDAAATLLVAGFVPLDDSEYAHLPTLASWR